jgi:hypothetical protein
MDGNTISLADAERIQCQAAAHRLPTFTAFQLEQTEFTPIRFIVPGFIPEGATILAGRPKLGKSWLALDLALAVALGTDCLGVPCQQGDVLYLALEDNQRRLQSRLQKLSPAREINPWPAALTFATEWRRHDAGGLDDMRCWTGSVDNPRLIIVDVLAQFRGGRANTESQYEADYFAVKGLQEIAGELQIGIIIVHHVRKGAGEIDPFEKVSGTLGLTGAADTTIVLDRDSAGCTLYCRGRDIQEYERAVTFDKFDCRWTVQGDVTSVRRTDERTAILEALRGADDLMTVKDIQSATGMNQNALNQLLFKMAREGQVMKVKRGHYVHPDRVDLLPPSKNDKKVRNDDEEDGHE